MVTSGAELPGLDPRRLRDHLEAVFPGMTGGPLEAEVIAGGRSNLTYLVGDGHQQWVVRRPPLGHVLATAHDMAREYRVLTALAGTAVPVPRTILLCQDENALGAPFYVMEYVPGTVYRDPEQTTPLTPEQRHALAIRLVDVLADLHRIVPEDVGLADFGRPEGFLPRQVRRWSKQLDASRSREIPGIDELAERLAAHIPTPARASIVHGDYRLDNLIIGADLRPRAVLDWEMATLGDPLADVGLLVVYCAGLDSIQDNPIAEGLGPNHGFPPAETLLDRYAERSGADLSELDWYIGFGYFKTAVIMEGIHYRFTRGQTVGEGFEQIGSLVQPLVTRGLNMLIS